MFLSSNKPLTRTSIPGQELLTTRAKITPLQPRLYTKKVSPDQVGLPNYMNSQVSLAVKPSPTKLGEKVDLLI